MSSPAPEISASAVLPEGVREGNENLVKLTPSAGGKVAALIAREAGCVVEAPDGGALRYPLDTTTPVAWMGYANTALARTVRPALRRVMAKYL